MPAVISPALTSAVAARPSAGAARNNDSTEGKRFDMALEQSRAAHTARTEEPADLAENNAGDHRRARGHERKSKLSADDVMAMLAPLPAPIVPLAAQLAHGGSARASGPNTAGLDPLAGDAAIGLARDPGAAATAGATATAPAATAANDDKAAQPHDAGHADARAATAAAEAAAPTASQDAATDGTTLPSPTDTVDFIAAANAAASGARPARPAAGSAITQAQQAGATGAAATAGGSALPSSDALAGARAAGGAAQAAGAATPAGDAAADATGIDATPPLPTWQATAGTAPADRTGAPSTATPVLSLAPRVGDDAWGPAIAQQLIRMSATGHHVAKLNLNPAELGPLKVTLTLSDNQTQAMFVSAHDAVRKAVEAALPQLRSTLAAQGIELGHTSVGAESQQPSGQGAAFAGQDAPRQRSQADYPGAGRSTAAASVATATPPPARARALSGLDTFA